MDPNLYDEGGNRLRLARLSDRGVDVWGADRVYVSEDVELDNIEPGAALYNATLTGGNTRVGAGSKLGVSGHTRIADCQIGRNVELGAGTFEGATFLHGAKMRGWAEVRPGTLLEEDAEAAHTVAFKNTILTAGAVTGSLINFCDAVLSGGTCREDHSEVGSGVVHFNFDPRGDKWGSMFGDATGVLLRSAPVFIGGQCGIVGPLHIDYGAVLAAGSMVRRNVAGDRIVYEAVAAGELQGFDREIYTGLRRKFLTTARLIGTLWAIEAWYERVRGPFADSGDTPLYEAARAQAILHVAERVMRLRRIIAKLERSISKVEQGSDEKLKALVPEHRRLIENEAAIAQALGRKPDAEAPPAAFLEAYEAARQEAPHVGAIQALPDDHAAAAAAWLRTIAAKPFDAVESLL